MDKWNIKNDWLHNKLASESALVSGHQSFASRIGLKNGSIPVIRVIKFRNNVLYLLTIQITDSLFIENKDLFIKATKLLNNWLCGTDELLTLVFSGSQDHDQEQFKLYNLNLDYLELNSNSLIEYFETNYPNITENKGTSKPKNTGLNDEFNKWTRSNLSCFCSVNDIDALIIPGEIYKKLIFIELKKDNTYRFGDWRPHIKDLGNYNLFTGVVKRIQKKGIEALYCVLSYKVTTINNELLDNRVALHYNIQIKEDSVSGKSQIHGCLKIFENTQSIKICNHLVWDEFWEIEGMSYISDK